MICHAISSWLISRANSKVYVVTIIYNIILIRIFCAGLDK